MASPLSLFKVFSDSYWPRVHSGRFISPDLAFRVPRWSTVAINAAFIIFAERMYSCLYRLHVHIHAHTLSHAKYYTQWLFTYTDM